MAASRTWTQKGNSATLLFARLSIVDLDERADQPMSRGTSHIAFNGEVYNYKEARAGLGAQGWKTDSDTEVLLTALRTKGPAALDAMEGMWAFAYYDDKDGSLLLCRDRFGEKPLYMVRDGADFYFGSEPKFIAALRAKELPVDLDQVKRYLVNGYKALYKRPRTFFAGLEELPPAHWLRLVPGSTPRLERYWNPAFEQDESMTYAQAVEGVRKRLRRAVELRLRADVPLAFCMSGGVDSNALIATAKRELGYDVHGFTIVNDDPRYDEDDLVQASVRELGIRHTAIKVQTQDFLPRLRELVAYHDAPVYTISYYAHWLLMQAIHGNGYRIAISGTAADELFSGYYDHHLAYLHMVRNDPKLRKEAEAAWTKHVKPLVRNPHLQDAALFDKDPSFRDHIYLDADQFSAALRQPWSEPFEEERYTPDLLRNRMLNELFHEAVPVILHDDDLNAMHQSIENRSPFLDRELFEFCCRIPTRHLVRDARAKAVLRDALEGIVPEAVRTNRRKVGFNAPIESFLDHRHPAVRAAVLADSPVYDIVRREAVAALMQRSEPLPNSESKFLFSVLSVKMFLEEHQRRAKAGPEAAPKPPAATLAWPAARALPASAAPAQATPGRRP